MFFNNKNILIIFRAKNPFGRVEILYKFAILFKLIPVNSCSLVASNFATKKYLNGIRTPAKKVIFILQTLI